MRRVLLLLGLLPSAYAVPLSLGISFESTDGLPTLALPYATYRASSYDKEDDVYTFKNIRFAAPPVGDLRWAKPAPPLTEPGVQNGTVGYQCYQAVPKQFSIGYPFLEALEPSSEDCLFLDVVAPGKAVRGEAKDLPVVTWIFGGGYVLGSKSFFLYNGAPLLKSSGNNIIYVAGNYRLGAFGFLNGPTMEKEGTTNAALWDQRAILQWVQDYIYLLGGDKNTVTAMGESAGAGSIMHHLTAQSGTLAPLFKRAIMMSPAFEPQYDPGRLQKLYNNFEKAAGCAGQGVACLRKVPSAKLQEANRAVINLSPYGTFGFGPSVDGTFVRDLAGIELAKGNHAKDISILLGHTSNEGLLFADPGTTLNSQFDKLLTVNFPLATAAEIAKIKNHYPEPGLFGRYVSNFLRLAGLIGEWVVSCNTRYLTQAYSGKVWSYQFSVPPGLHAIDLIFAFWTTGLDISSLNLNLGIDSLVQNNFATGFQSYLTSFIRTGNPSTYRDKLSFPPTINFPQASVGSDGVTMLDVNILGYGSVSCSNTPRDRCEYWQTGTWTGR